MNIREFLKDERVYLVASAIRGPDCPLKGELAVLSMVLTAVITGRLRALLGADYNFGYEIKTTPVSKRDCKRLLERTRECIEGLTLNEMAWFDHYVEHLHGGLVALQSLLEATEEEEKELTLMINVMARITEECTSKFHQAQKAMGMLDDGD